MNLFHGPESTYYIKSRGIPKGCEYCLQGAKGVLFLNGLCQLPPHCRWYCPLSEKRKGKSDSYINEIRLTSKHELIEELHKMQAKGMSITGGEPLYAPNLEKTLKYIKYSKNQMGSQFHIHLYTNGVDFTEKIAEDLAHAGLDEIRFHPSKKDWNSIHFALDKGISVGAELPIIPSEKALENLQELILYLDEMGAEFINLNEFEYCFPNSEELRKRGFSLDYNTIASVKGSKEAGISLIKKTMDRVSLKFHLCTTRAKDYYQLKNRYRRRAQTIKKPYEEITSEGLLIYGKITGSREDLESLFHLLRDESGIPPEMLDLDWRENFLKIPYYLFLEKDFLAELTNFPLEGRVVEITPFRGKYQQITEEIPLKVFIEEHPDYYED
ncbi:MAG: radical SAM protein [Promethearchaeia archaeon]